MRTTLLAFTLLLLPACGHELMDGPGDPGPLAYCIPTEEVAPSPTPSASPTPSPSVTPSPSPSPDPDDVTCVAHKTPGCVVVKCSDGTSFLVKGSKKHCGGSGL